ncbi:hypothetical protein Pcinc_026389 [Petrolisthes cinctipes]|uniref:La protein homolog n=1 Tax=Petrolisthes cinctipes TaxID=88211 RepID=A0AAE1F6R7_PETCI|nr:hypothetical protein Pcinc_026389 [Petrolisthes cinctipes]
MTEGEAATNGHKAEGEQSGDLSEKIVRQIQYYFGDYNLPRDKFLRQEIKNDDGWIPLDTMLKFKRLATLTTDKAVITTALKDATECFMEVDDSNEKIRRLPSQPLPAQSEEELREEALKRTVYCKGFPKDGSTTLDKLLEYFKQYGPYETVLMRYFFSKEEKKQGFKGSVLVVFRTEEKAKEFKELPEVTYEGTNLLRKWYADYMEEKKKEIEERKARKEAKKKMNQQDDGDKEALDKIEEMELPKGTFLHFSGLPEGGDASREDVKAALGDDAEQCAWVDYSIGKTEGYLRLKEEESNKTVFEKHSGKIKVNDVEVELRLVEGEEEEAQLKKMREARSRARVNSLGKKRRMGGGRGGAFKKRRT